MFFELCGKLSTVMKTIHKIFLEQNVCNYILILNELALATAVCLYIDIVHSGS